MDFTIICGKFFTVTTLTDNSCTLLNGSPHNSLPVSKLLARRRCLVPVPYIWHCAAKWPKLAVGSRQPYFRSGVFIWMSCGCCRRCCCCFLLPESGAHAGTQGRAVIKTNEKELSHRRAGAHHAGEGDGMRSVLGLRERGEQASQQALSKQLE